MGKSVIVAGIGSRKGVSAQEVLAAIDAALTAHGLGRDALSGLATTDFKRGETGIFDAARALGLEVVVVETPPQPASAPLGHESNEMGRTMTPLSLKHAGVGSVSEAAALGAAGQGARLLGPRTATGRVTCALATTEPAS